MGLIHVVESFTKKPQKACGNVGVRPYVEDMRRKQLYGIFYKDDRRVVNAERQMFSLENLEFREKILYFLCQCIYRFIQQEKRIIQLAIDDGKKEQLHGQNRLLFMTTIDSVLLRLTDDKLKLKMSGVKKRQSMDIFLINPDIHTLMEQISDSVRELQTPLFRGTLAREKPVGVSVDDFSQELKDKVTEYEELYEKDECIWNTIAKSESLLIFLACLRMYIKYPLQKLIERESVSLSFANSLAKPYLQSLYGK